ncbi:DUF2690 domain-containing protein [Streptomyces sp. NPDC005533]|uniref:DUF2690 domain-containing protein n=1 Tax=Streptomyces sp. NPDC005533 TaxID=3364723 RepID=UPI00368D05A0
MSAIGLFALSSAGAASAAQPTAGAEPAGRYIASQPEGVRSSGHAVSPSGVDPAAIYCDGASCHGVDPVAARSSVDGYPCIVNAFTPAGAELSTPRGHVELLYSPHCHSNWARISGAAPGTRLWVQNWDNAVQEQFIAPGQHSAHTAMVNGRVSARAGLASRYTAWY